jgi:hypothetical protein
MADGCVKESDDAREIRGRFAFWVLVDLAVVSERGAGG